VTASYAGGPDHLPSSSAPAALTVAPDQPPTVAITSPSNNGSVAKGKTITIAATATDDVGVARVVFSVSGAVKCTDTVAPYTCAWAVPKKANVRYTLLAVVTDTAGRTASHSIIVTAK
jgi:Bacterial Ig domain